MSMNQIMYVTRHFKTCRGVFDKKEKRQQIT